MASRFVAAVEAMAQDGWWWEGDGAETRRPSIKRQVLYEILFHRFPILAGARR